MLQTVIGGMLVNKHKLGNAYLLFAGIEHYPRGGIDDFVMEADSIEVLKERFSELQPEPGTDLWGHIVRRSDLVMVAHARSEGRVRTKDLKMIWTDGPHEVWFTDNREVDTQSFKQIEVHYRNGQYDSGDMCDFNFSKPDDNDPYSPEDGEEIMRWRWL